MTEKRCKWCKEEFSPLLDNENVSYCTIECFKRANVTDPQLKRRYSSMINARKG